MQFTIDLIKHDKAWNNHKFINKNFVKKVLKTVLTRFPSFNNTENIELALLLTNNAEITILNKNFRQKDKPTNVLSFPDQELDWRKLEKIKFEAELYIGDIAFAYEVIKKEAEENNNSFENHFTHLLVHAILHLIGFDHMNEQEAAVMEQHEIEILQQFNIPSPY